MKYPKIRQQANMTVKIPGFSGGINVYDATSEIEENQLVDADNMWWQNAALRTRPGMRKTGESIVCTESEMQWSARQWVSDRETLIFHTACKDGITRFRAARLSQDSGFEYLGRKDGILYRGTKTADGKAPTAFGCVAPKNSYVPIDEQTRYYFFLSSGNIVEENRTYVSDPYGPFEFIPARLYVPTICKSGKPYQAMNMLTGQFKATFSPDGETTLFSLPLDHLTQDGATTVEISLYDQEKNCMKSYDFTFYESDVVSELGREVYVSSDYSVATGCIPNYSQYSNVQSKRLYMRLDLTYGGLSVFMDVTDAGGYHQIPLPNIDTETITVTAWKTVKEKRMKICKMRQGTWFGNSRLFVCGNPDERNLIYWSDVNNPLYFPENNYVYVGDYSQSITAMRRQGELLAVFQENNLHGITYSLSDSDTYEYAAEVGVDATSVGIRVSVISIHSGIGCDCPDSVRLVNNRLVWATSDGKVYMLPSVNQYSERNVREISRNISPLLSQHSKAALQGSFAGEFGGYYVLLVDNLLYLLDAQNSAFANFNYYSKEDTAQKALPWYKWTLPANGFYCMMANDSVMLLAVLDGNTAEIFAMDGDTDELTYPYTTHVPIPCSFTSKMFDFDRPDKKKAVGQLYIGIGDSPESAVEISYLTEDGEYTDARQLVSRGDYGEREPGFMRMHRLTPHISRARLFGFRCQSEGFVCIGDIVLKFKEQGVVR